MSVNNIYICVTPFFPSPTHWQGAYVLDQVKAIQRNSDFEVVVFKTNPLNSKEEDYDIDGVHVYSICPLLMPSYILNGLTEGLVGTFFVKKLRQIGINPMDVAVVHCHTASHAAFGFGVRRVNPNAKVLIQFHDLDPYTLRNGKWADKRWNVRYRAKKSLEAFERADLLICISTPVQDNLLAFPKARPEEIYPSYLARLDHLKDFPSLKSRKTYILYNGVDTSLFNPRFKKQHDYFRIGCIGNFQELKDHITLIKAFDILIKKGYTNMRLSLLGTGEMRPMCEKYIMEHGLEENVEWPKEVPHDKLPDYYRSLNLFVLPSVYEGFGCVYTEAYACGVPFMGVYNQGAAEVIAPEERDKWLIQPHDHRQLAENIEKQYKEHGVQHLCQPYDIDELIKEYIEYLHMI
jgi:glycosyltransferase involved in cell wall biosynthesis